MCAFPVSCRFFAQLCSYELLTRLAFSTLKRIDQSMCLPAPFDTLLFTEYKDYIMLNFMILMFFTVYCHPFYLSYVYRLDLVFHNVQILHFSIFQDGSYIVVYIPVYFSLPFYDSRLIFLFFSFCADFCLSVCFQSFDLIFVKRPCIGLLLCIVLFLREPALRLRSCSMARK